MEQDTNNLGRILMQRFRSLQPVDGLRLSIEQNQKDWKDMCEEYNRLVDSKPVKISKSEFELKYSKFYNPENIGLLKIGTQEFDKWREDCAEFLNRINPYRPFEVVDDNDPNIVIRTFPPILRQVDTLNTPNLGKNVEKRYDEEGNIIDTNYLTSVVNNVFDKFSTHQLQSVRNKGATILHQCMHGVQNIDTINKDIEATDFIFQKFIDDCIEQNENSIYKKNYTNTKNDNDDSLESLGMQFE